jgi:hypothetical protein
MKVKKESTMSLVSNTGWFCFLFSILLYGCSNQHGQSAEKIILASLDAIGTKEDRQKIQNLISSADCISPDGKYTTEIHTASGGYSYFKQIYSYKPTEFEAFIENRDSGFIISDTLIPLSQETISMIRGHEFQNIVLEIDKRFHDFEKPENIESDGMKAYRIKVKDEANNECSLFFDVTTGLLSAIHFQNPGSVKENIKTRLSNWKEVQGILLPFHADIDQSGKLYIFDFNSIIFNSPGFKYKSVKK